MPVKKKGALNSIYNIGEKHVDMKIYNMQEWVLAYYVCCLLDTGPVAFTPDLLELSKNFIPPDIIRDFTSLRKWKEAMG